MWGQTKIIRILVEQGANTNVINEFSETPLSYACVKGDKEIIQILLKNGARTDIPNQKKEYPLYHCYKNAEIVELFVRYGFNINHEVLNGFNLLQLLVMSPIEQPDFVEKVVAWGADVNMVNKLWGETPIFFACSNGYEQVCQILIKGGADVNFTRSDGTTPIFNTLADDHINIAKLLVENEANIYVKIKTKSGKKEKGLLECAKEYKAKKILKFLKQKMNENG